MKRKLLGLFISVLLLTIVFSGCFENNKTNTQNNELDKFVGTWGEVYFTVNNTPVLFGEIVLYDNGTGKSYPKSNNFLEDFTYEILNGMIRFNFSSSRFWIMPSGEESYLFDFNYTFSNDYTKLTLSRYYTQISSTHQIELLKDYILSPTSEIQGWAEIDMNVSEKLSIIDNKSSFNMSVYNPVYSLMLIHECFALENETYKIIGRFKKQGDFFIIDFDNITEIFDCNSVVLHPYEKRTYKFIILNPVVGKYRIGMGQAIMNMWNFAQSFAESNEFTITID